MSKKGWLSKHLVYLPSASALASLYQPGLWLGYHTTFQINIYTHSPTLLPHLILLVLRLHSYTGIPLLVFFFFFFSVINRNSFFLFISSRKITYVRRSRYLILKNTMYFFALLHHFCNVKSSDLLSVEFLSLFLFQWVICTTVFVSFSRVFFFIFTPTCFPSSASIYNSIAIYIQSRVSWSRSELTKNQHSCFSVSDVTQWFRN